MAPRIALRSLPRLGVRPCALCSTRQPLAEAQRARGIATSYLDKVDEGDKRWKERAEKIQNGEIPHVWDVLAERGYIKDVAGLVAPLHWIIISVALTLSALLGTRTRSRRLCELSG